MCNHKCSTKLVQKSSGEQMRHWIRGSLLTFLAWSVVALPQDKSSSKYKQSASVSASYLVSRRPWNPNGNEICPLSVDDAIRIAKKQIAVDFPDLSVNDLLVGCKCSVIDSPEIKQDLSGELFVPTSPQFWEIQFEIGRAHV